MQEKDRNCLNDLMADGLDRYASRLHAFCWMTNHIHAVIQVSDQPLSRLMCWLASRYARYFNRRLKRTGHVFERRHRAILVTDDSYLLGLVRYIHLNPVEAGLVEDPEHYPWSSHRTYCGQQQLEWVTTRVVLSCFAGSVLAARRQYQQFMDADHDWTPNTEEPTDDKAEKFRMTNELVVPERLDESKSENSRSLAGLVEQYCVMHGLTPATLTCPGRRRYPARVRALISDRAISDGIATLTELAVYFRRAP
ncbi:MAG: transposase, partial [Woeseia sp.]